MISSSLEEINPKFTIAKPKMKINILLSIKWIIKLQEKFPEKIPSFVKIYWTNKEKTAKKKLTRISRKMQITLHYASRKLTLTHTKKEWINMPMQNQLLS